MADNDREDPFEREERPFQALKDQIANLSLRDRESDDKSNHEAIADEGLKVVEKIESLCMNCEENGETRLLLTKIPYFREIILMSFYCDSCGFSNTEVRSAGQIQEKGSKYTLTLDSSEDMERQVVKSDTAAFRVEELDIEMPAGHGRLTNVEGLLSEILKDLEYGQKLRKKEDPELYEKIEDIVQALIKMMLGGRFPFSITLDDPSGNSWIEPSAQDKDRKYIKSEYSRTAEQNAELGLGESNSNTDQDTPHHPPGATPHVVPQISTTGNDDEEAKDSMEDVDIVDGEVYSLPIPCPGCTKPAHVNLQLLNVPHFKQVIVSAVMCLACNYRSSDVKTGGEIPAKGKRIWLTVREPIDLRRDILKSETCCLKIPACDVEAVPGTMGGRLTTVEGLLTQIRDDLRKTIFEDDDEEGTGGDSMPEEKRQGWQEFFARLDRAIRGEFEYEILLEDPLANSYVQNLMVPEPDPGLREEEYARSAEEEDELGITDMKTKEGQDGEYEKDEITAEEREKAAKLIEEATGAGVAMADSGKHESLI
ncbi:MAG: hypothetical protein Q9167_005169 [Letrouitia subvulpina]